MTVSSLSLCSYLSYERLQITSLSAPCLLSTRHAPSACLNSQKLIISHPSLRRTSFTSRSSILTSATGESVESGPTSSKGTASRSGPLSEIMAMLGLGSDGSMGGGGGGGRRDKEKASAAVRRGMELFRNGDVAGSLQEFDAALRFDSDQSPYLWQRGLSLYYLEKYEDAAKQFRDDVAVNPNDTEESIWCFLSEAKLVGADAARKTFLEVGRDPRPVMRTAYELFKNGGDPQILVDLVDGVEGGGAPFYANLYIGLYHESMNDDSKAQKYIVKATQTSYGRSSQDYMASLARVHCRVRGWALP